MTIFLSFKCTVDIGHDEFRTVDKNGPQITIYAAFTKDAKFFMVRKFMLQALRRYNVEHTETTAQT